jgi:hypothetical protein
MFRTITPVYSSQTLFQMITRWRLSKNNWELIRTSFAGSVSKGRGASKALSSYLLQ